MRLALLAFVASVVGCYDPTTPILARATRIHQGAPAKAPALPRGGVLCAYPDSNCGGAAGWSGDAIGSLAGACVLIDRDMAMAPPI